MANTRSAKIAQRKSDRRYLANRSKDSRIKTFIKKVTEAITTGDHDAALKALRTAESEIMSGVSQRLLKLNTASRKVSRLSAQVKKLNKKAA